MEATRGGRGLLWWSAAAGAGLELPVPAVVEVAAAGRVVGGEVGGAAGGHAHPAAAEGADGDVGAHGPAAGGARVAHSWSVPRPEQGQTPPPSWPPPPIPGGSPAWDDPL